MRRWDPETFFDCLWQPSRGQLPFTPMIFRASSPVTPSRERSRTVGGDGCDTNAESDKEEALTSRFKRHLKGRRLNDKRPTGCLVSRNDDLLHRRG